MKLQTHRPAAHTVGLSVLGFLGLAEACRRLDLTVSLGTRLMATKPQNPKTLKPKTLNPEP